MKNLLIFIVMVLSITLSAGLICTYAIPEDSEANLKNWGNPPLMEIGKAYQIDKKDAQELWEDDSIDYAAVIPLDDKKASIVGKTNGEYFDESSIMSYKYDAESRIVTLFFEGEEDEYKFKVDLKKYTLTLESKPEEEYSLNIIYNISDFPCVVRDGKDRIVTDFSSFKKGDMVSISLSYPTDLYALDMQVAGRSIPLNEYFTINDDTVVNINLSPIAYNVFGNAINCYVELRDNSNNVYSIGSIIPAGTDVTLSLFSSDIDLYEFGNIVVNGNVLDEGDLPYTFVVDSTVEISCNYIERSRNITAGYCGDIRIDTTYDVTAVNDLICSVASIENDYILACSDTEVLKIVTRTYVDVGNGNSVINIPMLVFDRGDYGVTTLFVSPIDSLPGEFVLGWQDIDMIKFNEPINSLDASLEGWNEVFMFTYLS